MTKGRTFDPSGYLLTGARWEVTDTGKETGMTVETQEETQGQAKDTAQARAGSREQVRLKGQEFVDKVRELVHEGNVRRIVIKNDEGHTVIEIPVTAGVVAAIAAPVVTAVGAIAALAKEWSIEVERRPEAPASPAEPEKPTAAEERQKPDAAE